MERFCESTNKFQSTFPRGERRASYRIYARLLYFNPRSRVGNDTAPRPRSLVSAISIHVPAWGTTITGNFINQTRIISIHVPAWGTTAEEKSKAKSMEISIHVPAWGTTYSKKAFLSWGIFQSTFPRGERQWPGAVYLWHSLHFNPRSRVGNDFTIHGIPSSMKKFQSTFPRGERLQISTNILCPFYATSTIFYFYYPFSLFLLCYSFYFSYFFSANSPIILCLLLVRTYIIKG